MGTPTTPRRPYLVVASVTTKGGLRGTVGVDKIESIRRRARRGESVAGIARAEGVSEPTVRKYVRMGDLSPEPPRASGPESPTLAPHEATIDSWLEDDCRNWRKQRHTAVRVYVRLRDEEGYEGSYSTARRYVRRRREEMAAERDARDAAGYLELSWLPGECQVDFGEADSGAGGVTTRGHYPAVSFPHSNVGPAQVFWGETSECVCQGPGNVFEFAGGVPRRAVFDNATEVGRRMGGRVPAGDLFKLFAAHYGLDYSFTNPRSGNEKGSVGDEVGCHRRNLFVPVPSFHDVGASDSRLLDSSLAPGDGKPHHGRGVPEPGLFGEDRAALSPLPEEPFSCAGRPARRASKQGVAAVGGQHRYSAGPGFAGAEVAVAAGAFDVTLSDPATGEVVAVYEREWGDAPTDSSDPTLQLRLLCMRPGGRGDSVVRSSLPDGLVAFLDSADGDELARDLRVLRDQSAERGWAAAVEGMPGSIDATGGLDEASVALSAARAASGDRTVTYDEEVDLSAYDGALLLLRGGAGDAEGELRA